MSTIVVHPLAPGAALVGSVPVPSDRGIAARAVVLAALAEGVSTIAGVPDSAIVGATRALGVAVDAVDRTKVTVRGAGLFGLRPPSAALDVGSSRAALHLFAGVLAAQTFPSALGGDAALNARPLGRLAATLRARGAVIDGAPHATLEGELTAPLSIGPLPRGTELGELELQSPRPDPKLKTAALVSGLFAHGATWVEEPTLSADHTERLLHALGVPLRVVGPAIELDPAGWSGKMPAFETTVPGDASAAAYLVAAAQLTPGSRVTVRGMGSNPTRLGVLEIIRHMSGGVEVVPQGEHMGEPVAEVTAWHRPLRAALVGGELVARAQREIPIACALAARAAGETELRDLDGEERLGALATMLRAFGVACDVLPDGLVVQGREAPLTPARIDTGGDPAIAMTATVLGLHASAPSRIVDCDRIATVFPRFVGTLRALGARIDVE